MNSDLWTVLTYGAYAAIACSVTVWVARTLRAHVPGFFLSGDTTKDNITQSLTRLILMGFYLVNFGAISLALKTNARIADRLDAIELLSSKVGLVLLAQGIIHFLIVGKIFALRQNEPLLTRTDIAPRTPDDPNAF